MKVNIETERQDLFDVSILIAMRIHISGRASEDKLRDAFEKAVGTHEILRSRVCLDEDGAAYYTDNESGINNNKIVFERGSWQDIIHREEKKRFKIEEGEFLNAFVHKMFSEGCSILFLMHHLGGDGKSLAYFIETFMRYLSGDTTALTASSDFDKEKGFIKMKTIPAGDISGKALFDRVGPAALIPRSLNKKWNKDEKKKVFSFADLDQAYERYWEKKESVISEYVLSPGMVSRILDRCREWDIGFTAYVTTAFLRRFGRGLDIGFAVDAHEDKTNRMGNQATGISVKYSYKYEKSFKENAVKVQSLMNKKLEDDGARGFLLPFMAAFEPTLVDAINMEHAKTFNSRTSAKLAGMLGYGKKTKDLSITNLTRLDIPDQYGELKVDYYSFIPPVVSHGRNIIGLSTLGNNTVMTIHRIVDKNA